MALEIKISQPSSFNFPSNMKLDLLVITRVDLPLIVKEKIGIR